jgi:electron transport complex protein RnfB
VIDVDRIDRCLPQTQCRRCGYDDCRSYARALSLGSADIDRCPPGGDTTLDDLSRLLKRPATQLSGEVEAWDGMRIASIREAECIGCTKCIVACPVDAIVGSGKRMHTVITDHCTGCRLCLPPCPVDCIELSQPVNATGRWDGITDEQAGRYRRLRARNLARLSPAVAPEAGPTGDAGSAIRADIARAVARARARRRA